MTIFAMHHVAVTYGRQEVLTEISTQAQAGEVVAVLGRNGAGKSSLVRCLLGQQQPTRGQIEVFGLDSWRQRPALMGRVGLTPEKPTAPSWQNAAQLGRFCEAMYPFWDQAAYLARLERFRIPLTTRFGQLSRGQQSLVHLALALAPKPELLVLDDPTLGLDAVARRAIVDELIVELTDRTLTVLLTSHDFACVSALATRVAFLDRGRLVFDEEVDSLRERCRRLRFWHEDLARLQPALAELGLLSVATLGRSQEVVVAKFDPGLWQSLVHQSGLSDAKVEALQLEDIFLAYATEEKR